MTARKTVDGSVKQMVSRLTEILKRLGLTMIKQKAISDKVIILLFVITAAFVSIYQNNKVGFEKGHHGWVCSHHLSIITRSGAENCFVGYSEDIINRQGEHKRLYFNRAPFPFEMFCHYLLKPFSGDLERYVYFAKQIFNLVFLIILFFSYRFAGLFCKNQYLSFGAALLSVSTYFLIFYKDLIEHNRLGTLAFVVLFYVVAKYYVDVIKPGRVYITVLILSFFGEGAPSMFLLSVWCAFACIEKFDRKKVRTSITEIMSSVPFRSWCIGLVSVVILVSYNVAVESKITKVSLTETSIINSAMRRLGVNEDFNNKHMEKVSYLNYAASQLHLLQKGILPAWIVINTKHNNIVRPLAKLVLTTAGLVCFVIFVKRKSVKERKIISFIVISTLFYVIVLKNLFAFHDFPMTYYIGIHLLMYIAIVDVLPKKAYPFVLTLSALIFALSIIVNYNYHNTIAKEVNKNTKDFQVIKDIIGKNPKKIFVTGKYKSFYQGVPYALSFYLSGHYITMCKDDCDYIISHDKQCCQKPLTPDNNNAFLFEN